MQSSKVKGDPCWKAREQLRFAFLSLDLCGASTPKSPATKRRPERNRHDGTEKEGTDSACEGPGSACLPREGLTARGREETWCPCASHPVYLGGGKKSFLRAEEWQL